VTICYPVNLITDECLGYIHDQDGQAECSRSSFSDTLSFSRAASSTDRLSAMLQLPPAHEQGKEKKIPVHVFECLDAFMGRQTLSTAAQNKNVPSD
jgi:hypothetical protein